MHRFIVNETKFGSLIPLSDLVRRIGLENISHWRFSDVTMGHGHPFGMTLAEFESATRAATTGFEVGDGEVRAFLQTEFQILDGQIEAWTGHTSPSPVICFDCEDATEWEITTDRAEIAQLVEKAAFSIRT